jgi:hypothetical protein
VKACTMIAAETIAVVRISSGIQQMRPMIAQT